MTFLAGFNQPRTDRAGALPRALALSAALTLFGCGGGSSGPDAAPAASPPPAPLVAPGTWVVLGSSTAAGAGATAGNGWVDKVQAAYAPPAAKVLNRARAGLTSYHALPAATPASSGRPAADAQANIDFALSQSPTLIIVSFPTNDTALGYRADEVLANLAAIRRAAQARGVPVLALSTQPRTMSADKLAQLAEIDRGLAAEFGPCLADVRASLAAPDGRIAAAYDSGDGVHLNNAGHQVIADIVRRTLDARTCVRVTS